MILFAVYTVFYTAFVFLNAIAADTMETIVFAGLNLAIVYGFSLIILAIVMAVVYGFACRTNRTIAPESPTASDGQTA